MNDSADRSVANIYEANAEWWATARSRTDFSEEKYMRRVLGELSPGDALLDVGCGTGAPIADFFIKHGIKVTGIDTAPSLLKIARSRFPHEEWILSDMRDLHLKRKYAAVVAIHVWP